MGWAAALLVLVAADRSADAARPDFEVRIREQAVETLVRAIFPLRHEIGIPSLGLSMATVFLDDPNVRIDTTGVVLRAEMTVRSANAEASGPASFVFRPRYDARRRGLTFDLVESRADLSSGGRKFGAIDLSWVASELFVPTGQWIESETGAVWVDLVPSVRLRRGEIIVYGSLQARKARRAPLAQDASPEG